MLLLTAVKSSLTKRRKAPPLLYGPLFLIWTDSVEDATDDAVEDAVEDATEDVVVDATEDAVGDAEEDEVMAIVAAVVGTVGLASLIVVCTYKYRQRFRYWFSWNRRDADTVTPEPAKPADVVLLDGHRNNLRES